MEAFEGKNAVVVGGSGGIGFEISKMLLKNGAKVTVHGRNLEKLDRVRMALEKDNRDFCGRVETAVFDFVREDFACVTGLFCRNLWTRLLFLSGRPFLFWIMPCLVFV